MNSRTSAGHRAAIRFVPALRAFGLGAALTLAATAATGVDTAQAQLLITLADGQVQGHVNGDTREFLGIPYAAPPTGALRWRPPAPVTPWGGVLDASSYSSACP